MAALSHFVIERLAVEPNLLIWFKKYRCPRLLSLALSSRPMMNMRTICRIWCVRCLRGSHGLGARRARRTKSRGPKGPQLEVGARRAPRLLVSHILNISTYRFHEGRPVEAILEREAAEHLVERGTRRVEGDRLVFSRDRRFTLFTTLHYTFMQTKYMKHVMHIMHISILTILSISNISSARHIKQKDNK